MKTKLAEAIELRKNKKPEEAMQILTALLESNPNDPDINYQMAWTCDFMGKESEAVPFYEKAIANGLKEDRSGAMLGLGSTYLCLGEYEKSLKVFDQAIREFPEIRLAVVVDEIMGDIRPIRVFNSSAREKRQLAFEFGRA